jgi:hypothetical protein
VRKSVANNLNDISKTRPDVFIKIASDWYGENNHTNWIIKHGSRTLLKKGNNDILTLLGLNDNTNVTAENFSLDTTFVPIGNALAFSFMINAKQPTKVRLEYAIDYVKSRGKRNRKIFKISEVSLKADERKHYTRNHSFANLSTRKHFPGTHSISLIINGVELGKIDFEVTM